MGYKKGSRPETPEERKVRIFTEFFPQENMWTLTIGSSILVLGSCNKCGTAVIAPEEDAMDPVKGPNTGFSKHILWHMNNGPISSVYGFED